MKLKYKMETKKIVTIKSITQMQENFLFLKKKFLKTFLFFRENYEERIYNEAKEFKTFESSNKKKNDKIIRNKKYYVQKKNETVSKNKDLDKTEINDSSKYKSYKSINNLKGKEFNKIDEKRNYKGLDFLNNIFFYINILLMILKQRFYESKKEDNISNIERNIKNKNNKKIECKRNKKVKIFLEYGIQIKLNIKIILLLLIINLSLQTSVVNEKCNFFQSKFSNITLKIKGKGYRDILSNNVATPVYYYQGKYPDNVYINEIKQDVVNYSYYFNLTDNFVVLVWNQNINSCKNMFKACKYITEIDLSNFDSSNIESTHAMFWNCKSLTSINFTNFNTSNVIDMYDMFSGCSLLVSLDLSNFDTLKVIRDYSSGGMRGMFLGCSSLVSLNLSNFNTKNVINMFEMFKDCSSLEYINLLNFNEFSLKNSTDIFKNIQNNIVVCINKNITSDKIFPQIAEKMCYTIDCSEDWQSKQKKYINITSICITYCKNKSELLNEYFEECYRDCISESSIINKSHCEYENCLIFPEEDSNKKICTKCNTNYYPIENETKIIGTYINCYKDLKGYYLDEKDLLFKKCYGTCSTCNTKGDNITHNCLECNSIYSFGIKLDNYTNCYENCSYYYIFDDSNSLNKYYCTQNYSCPKEYPILILDKRQCIKNDIKNIIQEIIRFEKNEKNETNEKDVEEEIKYYDKIIKQIEEIFTSENYDTSNLDNGKDESIETEKMTITFTTTKNQKNNVNNNITTINLGECEKLLKKYYNISEEELLYIKKTDVNQEGMKITKTEYDIYNKLSGTSFINLNLSVCKNSKIYLSVPIIIVENIDILNSSSGYYNDICYTAKSDSGTDISLKDRKKEFIEGNKTVCQEDCIFIEYDYIKQKANCSCKVKESSSSLANMNININKLYENFIDIKNIMNFKLMTCYKILFSKKGFIFNILCFTSIPFILFHFLTVIIFYKVQKNIINKKINDISYGIQNLDLVKKKKKRKIIKKKKRRIRKNNNIIIKQDIINTIIKKENIIQTPSLIDNYVEPKLEEIQNPPIKKRKNIVNIENNNIKIKKKSSINSMINENINNEEIIEKCKKIMEYNDEEINNLDYDLALKYDNRAYCQYYISLLKTKHIFIFTFFNNKDYNSKIIKIDLFLINFSIVYAVNALFFNDDTMHKIYEDKGSYNFTYQLPQIIYSSLISGVLNVFFKFLALSESDILKFKKLKEKNDLNKKVDDLNNKLEIKWISFFIISFILLLYIWYYLSMFGAVYRYTQIHLIKDTLISFGLSLIYPFGIYLIPGIFRIPSLSNKKNKKNYSYKMSLIIQMI